jgi:Pyruvate/2-oxoacid:ferredoxin oxidoreductase delta subunit
LEGVKIVNTTDVYRELAGKVGMRDSKFVPDIWRTICSKQEAEIINAMPATRGELSDKFGKTDEEMSKILQQLFIKGVVFDYTKDGKTYYRMPRHILQFHDATVLWKDAPQSLFDLWAKYTDEEFSQIPEMLTKTNASPFFRVIPVNETIETKNQVLAYEDAVKIIENASSIALTKCTCRLVMKKCNKPVDVCLQLNRGADYAIKRGTGRRVDVAQAKEILRKAEESGLVHMTENKGGMGNVLCNCCDCCCMALSYLKNPATKGIVAPSRYQASVNGQLCTSCALCIDICPVKALSLGGNSVASVNQEICLGCGLCARECPTKAITLVRIRKENFIPI